MIIVEPSSARFEVGEHPVSTDEHLLERISIVENRITRVTERLERTLDLLLRQAQNSYYDRSLIKALISLLSDDGLVESTRLERLWNERCEQDAHEQNESTSREALRLKILATPPAHEAKAFKDLVGQAFVALEDGHTGVGIDKLRQAAEMTESNCALNLFIGEHFFKHGKARIARTYLSKVHYSLPDDLHVSLLLGLTCADEGDSQTAKLLIARAIELGGSCFSGHCGLGWLHVTESNWRKALSHFKRALEVRPSPEAHFVLASLYYKLERDSLAIRHLRKAVDMDVNYYEALNLLALVYKRSGNNDLAQDILSRVQARASVRPKTKRQHNRKVGPLFDGKTSTERGLLCGNRRLMSALRDDALRAFVSTNRDLG